MNLTKITQIGKTKVNVIEIDEISGIELVDNVLCSCCFSSAGKCPQIRCTTERLCYPKSFSGNANRTFEDTQATAGDYYHIPEARFSEAVCEYSFE